MSLMSLAAALASLGVHDLERHRSVVLEVLRQVDRGHASVPELALDAVALAERNLQALDGIRH